MITRAVPLTRMRVFLAFTLAFLMALTIAVPLLPTHAAPTDPTGEPVVTSDVETSEPEIVTTVTSEPTTTEPAPTTTEPETTAPAPTPQTSPVPTPQSTTGTIAPQAISPLYDAENKDASLNIVWTDGLTTPVTNRQNLTARITWDENYYHGYLSDQSGKNKILTATVYSGRIADIPAVCGPESTISPNEQTLTCYLELPDDEGMMGYVDVPVMVNGSVGNAHSVYVTDEYGNRAQNARRVIQAVQGVDLALNQAIVVPGGMRLRLNSETREMIIPATIFQQQGAPALGGQTVFDLKLTSFQHNVFSTATNLRIVPLNDHGPSLSGIPLNTTAYPAPTGTVVRTSADTLRVTITNPNYHGSVKPFRDTQGNLLPLQPQATFGIAMTVTPLPSGSANSIVVGATLVRAGTLTTEMAGYANNNTSVASFNIAGAYSAKFASSSNRRVMDVNDMPAYEEEAFNPDLDPALMVKALSNWAGNGPAMPGDQITGLVQMTPFNAMESIDSSGQAGLCLAFDASAEWNGKTYLWPSTLNDTPSAYTIQYTTSALNYANLNCGVGTWSNTPPADRKAVTGIRLILNTNAKNVNYTVGNDSSNEHIQLRAGYVVPDNAAMNSSMWIMGAATSLSGTWFVDSGHRSTISGGYGSTHNMRDHVRIIGTRTAITVQAQQDSVPTGGEIVWNVVSHLQSSRNAPATSGNMQQTVTIPAGLEYVSNYQGLNITATKNANGTTTLRWNTTLASGTSNIVNLVTKHVYSTGSYRVNADIRNTSQTTYNTDTSTDTVSVSGRAGVYLNKESLASEFAADGDNAWIVTLDNRDALRLGTTDTIDILPYDGDGRGTVTSATTTINDITVTGPSAARTAIWVTTADPTTLNYDPSHASNGSIGTPSSIWTPYTGQTSITGIRWITTSFDPGSALEHRIEYTTAGSASGDVLVNSVQTRTDVMPTTAINSEDTTSLVEPSDVQVDKSIINGVFEREVGDVVTYRLTVHNPGPSTNHNVHVHEMPGTGLTDVSFMSVPRGEIINDGLSWNVGTLTPGQTFSATVRGTVGNYAVVPNGVQVNDSATPGEWMENCVPNEGVLADTDGCDVVESNVILRPGSISGTSFFDNNEDGVLQGDDETIRYEGQVIELVDDEYRVIATTTTDEFGYYEFTEVPIGEYRVRNQRAEGGDPTTDYDTTTPGGVEGTATLTVDDLEAVVDFGFYAEAQVAVDKTILDGPMICGAQRTWNYTVTVPDTSTLVTDVTVTDSVTGITIVKPATKTTASGLEAPWLDSVLYPGESAVFVGNGALTCG